MYLADTGSQGGFQGFMKQRLCSPDELRGRMLQLPFCVVSALLSTAEDEGCMNI